MSHDLELPHMNCYEFWTETVQTAHNDDSHLYVNMLNLYIISLFPVPFILDVYDIALSQSTYCIC